jgi:glutamate-5-semialdehyde dehydrogenase
MSGLREQLADTRATLPLLAALDGVRKDAALRAMAGSVRAQRDAILAANAHDLAQAWHVTPALRDRLALDAARVEDVARALEAIAALPDPVGRLSEEVPRPSGIRVQRMRVPLGAVAMIYEARPNVTAEAAALCFKAGNACVLRGGSEAYASNRAIERALHLALEAEGLPLAAIRLLHDTRREAILELVRQDDLLDLVIPRGGEGLIRFVAEHSRVPVIRHYKGVCHLYVDRAADLDQAVALVVDGKTSRPGVCNALETLLVHRAVAEAYLPRAAAALRARGVELRGCARTRALVEGCKPASDDDYAAEYLDLILAVAVVDDFDAALAHIARYGSQHTEVIATRDEAAAARFVRAVDASAVIVNASSRFNDGGELGLGAEIGISTTKLHAYGPMGLEALTTQKFVIHGSGQLKQRLEPA